MTTVQNNRNHQFNSSGGNDRDSFKAHDDRIRILRQSHTRDFNVRARGGDSFEEHNECMQVFRRSHLSDLEVKVSRRDLLDSMPPLQVSRTMIETGGSRGLIGTAEWLALIPMRKVAPSRFSQN